MGHPVGNQHRAHHHERERLAHLTGKHESPKHYARGGKVHDDEAEDRALIKKSVKKGCMRADGGAVKQRADKAMRRAKGGKTMHKGHSKTNVNVIVAPGGGKPPMAGLGGGMAPPPAMAAPPMPPKPPMAPPPPASAMGGPPLGGMPPRKKGGRVTKFFGDADMSPAHPQSHEDDWGHGKPRARGGKIEGKKSLADMRGVTGIGERTPIQHSGNKSDTQNSGRKAVITKATGGPIYSDGRAGKEMGPHIGAGNSGVGRLRKQRIGSPMSMKP